MAKYGPGVSFDRAAAMDRDEIIQALEGKRICGETEKGWEYEPCTREEAKEIILGIYDQRVYEVKDAYHHGRATELLLKKRGIELHKEPGFMQEYLLARAETVLPGDPEYIEELEKE